MQREKDNERDREEQREGEKELTSVEQRKDNLLQKIFNSQGISGQVGAGVGGNAVAIGVSSALLDI